MNVSDRQTRTIIVVVLAVLFGCAGIFTCAGTVMSLLNILTNVRITRNLFAIGQIGNLCAALAFVALPIALYFLLLYEPKEKEQDEVKSMEEPRAE